MFILFIKLNLSVLLSRLWNFFKSSDIKKRNKINDRGEPWGMPVSV